MSHYHRYSKHTTTRTNTLSEGTRQHGGEVDQGHKDNGGGAVRWQNCTEEIICCDWGISLLISFPLMNDNTFASKHVPLKIHTPDSHIYSTSASTSPWPNFFKPSPKTLRMSFWWSSSATNLDNWTSTAEILLASPWSRLELTNGTGGLFPASNN